MIGDLDGTMATGNGKGHSQTQEEGSCDRRLSRAARKLVHQHLLQVIQAENKILYHGFLDHSDVWVLLEHWLHANGRRMDHCPLNPSLDAYRIDEEHSLVVDSPTKVAGAYPTFVAQQRAKRKGKRIWFECGYNGKTFSSRYYLDAHLDKHHRLEEFSTFCPALDWCRAVGLSNCHATALEDEPYYGQGSDGWGDDGNLLKHQWVKKAHSIPCNVATIREDCHLVMDRCGVTDSTQRWCDSLVCPTHRLGAILSSSKWSNNSFGSISYGGTFLVAIIIALVYCCFHFRILDFEDEPFGQSYVSPRPGSTRSCKTKNVARNVDGKVRDFRFERTAEKRGKDD
ncbi:unnamed protein product [Cylindrotheca closterium]|uniref:Uncharacterized protein n=1 Tax=Cylindrotheca closterium TaxID=2856 RepID=A0AAD2JKI4_9STRA|nr:unnamed protein product [Cylindrotheca closterium]